MKIKVMLLGLIFFGSRDILCSSVSEALKLLDLSENVKERPDVIDVIKDAYNKLLLQHDQDKLMLLSAEEKEKKEQKFIEIKKAYEFLIKGYEARRQKKVEIDKTNNIVDIVKSIVLNQKYSLLHSVRMDDDYINNIMFEMLNNPDKFFFVLTKQEKTQYKDKIFADIERNRDEIRQLTKEKLVSFFSKVLNSYMAQAREENISIEKLMGLQEGLKTISDLKDSPDDVILSFLNKEKIDIYGDEILQKVFAHQRSLVSPYSLKYQPLLIASFKDVLGEDAGWMEHLTAEIKMMIEEARVKENKLRARKVFEDEAGVRADLKDEEDALRINLKKMEQESRKKTEAEAALRREGERMQKEKEEILRRQKEEENRKKVEEAALRRQEERMQKEKEEMLRRQKEEDNRKKVEAEEAALRRQEERMQKEKEEILRRQDEENRKKAEEAALHRQEERMQKEKEEMLRRKKEEENRKKVEAEEAALRREEERMQKEETLRRQKEKIAKEMENMGYSEEVDRADVNHYEDEAFKTLSRMQADSLEKAKTDELARKKREREERELRENRGTYDPQNRTLLIQALDLTGLLR